jgi:hypothetical protein
MIKQINKVNTKHLTKDQYKCKLVKVKSTLEIQVIMVIVLRLKENNYNYKILENKDHWKVGNFQK